MTPRHWWWGVGLLTAAIVFHALVPRYDWRNVGAHPRVRVDRWTGTATYGSFEPQSGAWRPGTVRSP